MTKPASTPPEGVRFVRRRYGSTTYTWAHVTLDGQEYAVVGDPWPSVHVPRRELAEAIAETQRRIAAGTYRP